jgi:hypothetical protein
VRSRLGGRLGVGEGEVGRYELLVNRGGNRGSLAQLPPKALSPKSGNAENVPLPSSLMSDFVAASL